MDSLPIWVFLLLFVMFVLIPAFFLWAGLKMIRTTIKFNKGAIRVQGTVFSVRKTYTFASDESRGYTYYPTYEYKSPDGATLKGETAAGSGNWNYPIGRRDDVMVNLDDPTVVRYPGLAFYLMGAILFAFAAIFFGTGVFMVFSVMTAA